MKRGRILVIAAAVLLIGAGTWWGLAGPLADDESIKIPERVCGDRIPGESVVPLLPAKGKQLQEDTYELEVMRSYGVCSLEVGGEEVGFEFHYIPGATYSRDRVQREGTPVSLGAAYGYVVSSGDIRLYVPCRWRKETDRLIVTTGASVVEGKGAAVRKLDVSDKEVRAFAEFAADVTRSLARGGKNWHTCPGADRLPDGPVTLDRRSRKK
ncbi:hypothetical protein ACQUSR_23590 [Streptomyces sp. P1-3]|uniref:hypothetical protein n=1 Tax=Streptomyces sp. P1-3 TaxID=3421658 RepID=UPI003D367D1C